VVPVRVVEATMSQRAEQQEQANQAQTKTKTVATVHDESPFRGACLRLRKKPVTRVLTLLASDCEEV
jgi:hypothetical protein